MRSSILSLEDLNQETDQPTEVIGGDAVQEANLANAQFNEVDDQIEEATSIDESLGRTETVLESGVESGEGVGPDTAEAIDAALEHFQTRLNVSPKKRIALSQEDFGSDKEARLRATMESLQEVRTLRERLQKQIVVSIEDHYADQLELIEKRKAAVSQLASKLASTSAPKGESKKISAHKLRALGGLQDGATGKDVAKRMQELVSVFHSTNYSGALADIVSEVKMLLSDLDRQSDSSERNMGSLQRKMIALSAADNRIKSIIDGEGNASGEIEGADSSSYGSIKSSVEALINEQKTILSGWSELIGLTEDVKTAVEKYNRQQKGTAQVDPAVDSAIERKYRKTGAWLGFAIGLITGPGVILTTILGAIGGHIAGMRAASANRKAQASANSNKIQSPNNPDLRANNFTGTLQDIIAAGVDYLSSSAE